MNFLIDIGYTRMKWFCELEGRAHDQGAMMIKGLSAAELQVAIGHIPSPSSIWISNVGSIAVLEIFLSYLGKQYETQPILVTVSKQSCGVSNNYQDLESLGVDRWVAAIGARTLVRHGNLIVIDAGTAITIDWLSAKNTYEGGVILPGTQLMHDSLVGNTANIASSFYQRDQIIGRTTSECVNSGVGFGLGGAVDRVVAEISEEIIKNTPKLRKRSVDQPQNHDQQISIVVTGGGCRSIKSQVFERAVVEPNLVLLGLQRIAHSGAG